MKWNPFTNIIMIYKRESVSADGPVPYHNEKFFFFYSLIFRVSNHWSDSRTYNLAHRVDLYYPKLSWNSAVKHSGWFRVRFDNRILSVYWLFLIIAHRIWLWYTCTYYTCKPIFSLVYNIKIIIGFFTSIYLTCTFLIKFGKKRKKVIQLFFQLEQF